MDGANFDINGGAENKNDEMVVIKTYFRLVNRGRVTKRVNLVSSKGQLSHTGKSYLSWVSDTLLVHQKNIRVF